MKKFVTQLSILLFLLNFNLTAQSDPPKREFRGAWIASVVNLDWPSSPFLTVQQQKSQLISILDELQKTGINVVVFQVRPECDALYNSPYEPWSYYLTGSQGTPPNPYYDPLEFAIDEAHKRGMELHAWFNPYRAVFQVGHHPISSEHVTVENPEWALQFGTLKILNPGLQQVRDYNTMIIMDVVRRYDVDGVHFDDYFYPYPPNHMTANSTNDALDDAAFSADPRGFTNKADWRRDNVNIQMKQIHDSIMTEKPHVKFGISPFGIWRNGVPSGIVGMDAYSAIYADPIAWLHDGSVDYLTPQLYWRIGGGQDYSKLMPWWADSIHANERHLYTGHILDNGFSSNELPSQLKLNRGNFKVSGAIWFRADLLNNNALGFRDSLRNNYYKYPALLPVMNWKDTIQPNIPQNLRFDQLASTGRSALQWDAPIAASDGDTASRYVVYLFSDSNIQPEDLDNPQNIVSVEGNSYHVPAAAINSPGPYYFVVTSLDRNYNESGMTSPVQILAPEIPTAAFPVNGASNIPDTVTLQWNYSSGSSFYHLQVSSDPAFSSGMLVDLPALGDTFFVLTGMIGQQQYYWRISSSNIAGQSDFSSISNFTSGFPTAPILLEPPHASLEVVFSPILKWAEAEAADIYQIQLSNSTTFNSSTIIFDSTGIADTSYMLNDIEPNRNHFWRVRGINQYGASRWSSTFGFKTMMVSLIEEEGSLPTEYTLAQNYPNPFNPSTRIKFSVPNNVYATLKVYDLLGNEIASLVDRELSAGNYSVEFDASYLASGTYIYRISAGEFIQSRKMILVK
jgi:uncharacterized lipoprotein YddW (UPF0748 family)